MRPVIKTDADIIGGWGLVPALDGDLATVTPNPTDPTAPTATTDQQTQTAATTAIIQQTLLPPPPPPNACITADGHSFSQAFYIWLLKLQQRVGGFSASPTNDAAVLAYDPYPRPTEPSHDLSFDTSLRPTPFMEWQVDPSPRPTNPEDLWPAPDVRQWVLAQHYPSDSLVVHKAGTETITGDKTFTGLVNADEVRFTAGITPANTLGTTYWDADSQTLATIVDVTNGVALQHGQEVMIRCVNKTGSIITDGQVVYVNDAQGNRPTAALAKADNITTSMCIGVATQNIAINAEGFVTTIGLVHGYDTRAFIDGQKMYLSNVTAGLLTPTAGTVRFLGQNVTGVPAHDLVARGLALVPEGRRIFARLSVVENLRLGAFQRQDVAEVAQDLDRLLTLFPILAERRHQAGGTLSGGEQQMLAIARALMSRPRLLLMDEPSMGVAPLITERIFATIKQLNREGLAILLVEQNATAALGLAHRGYVLETGRVTLNGQAHLLLDVPRVQAAYLGA